MRIPYAFLFLLMGVSVSGIAESRRFEIAPRQELNFSNGWVFVPKDISGAEQYEFDDHGFERVSVPHANIITPHETFDPDMFRFISWYRKHFRPDESLRGKKVLIDFQGVMTVADVYLNGHLLGHHEGGYTPFSFDLTSTLKFGEENVLAVRVDSREQKEVPPEGANKMFGYYLFGGIQRDVVLRVVDAFHIDRVYYTTVKIDPRVEEEAQVTVTNARPASMHGTLAVHLYDSQGGELASQEVSGQLAPGETRNFRLSFDNLHGIQLWDVDHPNRYVIVAELRDTSTIIDCVRTWIGFRMTRWDALTGQFLLNGHPLKLRGMNRHQTFAYVGGAVPNRLQRRDARVLKYELGLNMMRSSHYPPDPEFLDECDRIGLLVMDEFPSWQFISKSQQWQENAIEAVRDMILRDRNHPSIILWGVRGNEASPQESDDRDLYLRTYGLARKLDPTRAPSGARLSDTWHGKFVPEEVVAVNDYSNWSDPARWPQPVTAKPWLITEFGHPKQFPVWAGENELLQFALNWMTYLEGIYSHPEIAGGVGWAAFDYNSPEFDTPVAVTAHHCVNDIFRLSKGFGAFALASQVDAAIYGPMVKIMSQWRNNDQGKIYVASNASEVELLINSKSLGRAKPTEFLHIPNPLFAFMVASFDPGEVEARAWRDGKVVATDKVRTPGRARRLVLNSDDSQLVADGADMTRVIAEAVDENGTRVPNEDRRIFIEVKNGRFIGESPIHLEGGRIAFYVQTRESRTLPIAVSATAEGLEGGGPISINVNVPTSSLVPLSEFDVDGLAIYQ